MDKDTALVIFKINKRGFSADLEVPLDITANELITGLNTAYNLDIDASNIMDCYLRSENPIALLRGNRSLKDFGIRNGTVIYYTK